MLSFGIRSGHKSLPEELQSQHSNEKESSPPSFHTFQVQGHYSGTWPGAAMGWAWVEILARPCVYECLPSNLSQHFTKHVENHLTHTALCLDPARPCPLHNLLLFILCSELISSLFTFSGRHSSYTLTRCSSSLSCPLSKNYVPFLWNTYMGCVCVFKCGCRALVNFFLQ